MPDGIGLAWGGQARVYCLHDRQKREVTTEDQLAEMAPPWRPYDPRQDKIHRCSCCDNLFTDPTDEPKRCYACRVHPAVHPQNGPLREPIGVVDE